MALAVLNNVLQRVIAILNAHPGAWSTTVTSGLNTWPSDSEINAACLEADEMVATQGYFQSRNSSLSTAFETLSSNLIFGAGLPFHHGSISKVELVKNLQTFLAAGVNVGANTITITAHGFTTGDRVQATGGALPTGITNNSYYYVLVVDANTIKLYTDPLDVTSIVDITAAGTAGTLTQWVEGVKVKNVDEIINAKGGVESYVGANSFAWLYALDNNQFYSTADYGRVTYPEYTRSTALQCNKNEESLIVFTAVAILAKHASPALFDYYDGKSQRGLQQLITDGVYTPEPDEEQEGNE